jgi:hypothetical protein
LAAAKICLQLLGKLTAQLVLHKPRALLLSCALQIDHVPDLRA